MRSSRMTLYEITLLSLCKVNVEEKIGEEPMVRITNLEKSACLLLALSVRATCLIIKTSKLVRLPKDITGL